MDQRTARRIRSRTTSPTRADPAPAQAAHTAKNPAKNPAAGRAGPPALPSWAEGYCSIGQDTEFADFYRMHFSSVRSFLRIIGADQTEAEDATQSAMTALLEHWGSVSARSSWVRTTARNEWLKDRTRRREQPSDDPLNTITTAGPAAGIQPTGRSLTCPHTAGDNDPETLLHRRIEQDHTVDILLILPKTQREILALVVDGYAPQEIADLTGRSEAGVRSNLAHARRRLRRLLNPRPSHPPRLAAG